MKAKIPTIKLYSMELTGREVHIIKVMRGTQFGTFVIKKFGGKLVRIEPRGSILLKDDPEQELAVDTGGMPDDDLE